MADNKVTIDAAYFAELWKIANEADEVCKDCVREKCGECAVVKERDELKAKLDDAKAHYCTSATGKVGDACKVAALCRENEAKLAAAERCIEEAFEAWTQEDGTDASYNRIGEILRAYREKKEAAR